MKEMSGTLLTVEHLTKWFPIREGILASVRGARQRYVKAVDDVSFEIKEREVLGLVGESGCGKTTTGRTVLRLVEPTSGKAYFKGTDVFSLNPQQMKHMRSKMQIIYQDPYEALNPRMTVLNIVAEPLRVHNLLRHQENTKEERVARALEEVNLVPPQEFMNRLPHELSGGQRQRVAVARGLMLRPELIVADEPVSMLDVSIRAGIISLMLKLGEQHGISYLFITHDLAVAKHSCDRVAVMYLGRIVETGRTDDLVREPLHPYTEALVSAVPIPDPTAKRKELVLSSETPNPIDLPLGCRFHPRCPEAMDICRAIEPQLAEVRQGRHVACHLYDAS
jgi:oligopeptide/dipeptide ABC transporter ATP-binding protein